MNGKAHVSPAEELRRTMALKRHRGNVTAAARELGMPAPTLQHFARIRKLNREGKGVNTRLPLKEVMRRVHAWLVTHSDREAAKMLGMKVYTFTRWRVRHHLPGKNYKGRKFT